MTIREWLENHGGVDMIAPDSPGILDNEIHGQPKLASTAGTGDLQFCCGGDVIVIFPGAFGENIRGSAFLVRDDGAGRRWDAQRRAGSSLADCGGPRPHAKLRLVW